MHLELDDETLLASDKEPGSYYNAGEHIVLLRTPDLRELQDLWDEFDRDLRSELKNLMLRPYGEIVEKFGPLGFRSKNAEDREAELFGMLMQNSELSAHFKKPAVFQAAAAFDIVSDMKANGQPRKRAQRGDGRVLEIVRGRPRHQQCAVMELIIDEHENLDEWMVVSQGSAVAWQKIRSKLRSATDSIEFLRELAALTDRMMGENLVTRHADSGEKIEFAPTWFSQFLARKKIWVWPARYLSRVAHMYPSRFVPLVGRMSVEPENRAFADTVFRYHQGKRHDSDSSVMQVFSIVALAGNAWDRNVSEGFRWYPLAGLKADEARTTRGQTSASANTVFRLVVEHAGGNPKTHSAAHYFLTSAKLAKTGVDAFNWVLNPNSSNTQLASRILGREITQVPRHVKAWADQLREIIPFFEVKAIKIVEDALNPWLLFLMDRAPEDCPVDWQSISRAKHIRDLHGQDTTTFWNFVQVHFSNTARGQLVMSKMEQAYNTAATIFRFTEPNPFDPKVDKITPPSPTSATSANITVRKPLDLKAWELIVRKNREGNYEFARSLGPRRCHYRLRNHETGQYELVFWPAEAIVVDIVLNSGMRHVSARWVDSGEGDQNALDRETMKPVLNDHPSATIGRNRSFLQIVDLPGYNRRKVFGQFVGLNKTGGQYVIPWVDNGVVDAFYQMRDLQKRYNPIDDIVKQIDRKNKTKTLALGNLDNYIDVYPLFRDPDGVGNEAISDNKVLSYWKLLLAHCQEDIYAILGNDYHLTTEDGLVFDLHSLRVTMVSNLLELGVDIEIVRDLVGHASKMMTWYYNALRSSMMNRSIQQAMEARHESHDALAAKDPDAIDQYAAEAIEPDFIDKPVGKEMLRAYKKRRDLAPFEIFLHGVCPGGSCATGGKDGGPVWRERACSGCRYRVTGPRFLNGMQNKINNLSAELRMSGKRMQQLSMEIEEREMQTGKTDKRLQNLMNAENAFKDNIAAEIGRELRAKALAHEVAAIAIAEGRSPEDFLLPVSTAFDPANLEYGFTEVHEFELFHSCVAEARLLPASIIEVAHGVEAEMKKMINIILRVNNLSDLTWQIGDRQQTELYIKIGDALLRKYPEAADFQGLIEGTVRLDREALEDVRSEFRAVLASTPSIMPQLEHDHDELV